MRIKRTTNKPKRANIEPSTRFLYIQKPKQLVGHGIIYDADSGKILFDSISRMIIFNKE